MKPKDKPGRIDIEVDGKIINTRIIDTIPSLWGGVVYVVKINGHLAAVDPQQVKSSKLN